ncbi:hypothetical protein FB451DRAFT_1527574 [Mycena latifolia]|nr:hypothetical protein FB451DRAFT_1527574 [Mycena latifolia]
MPRTSSMHGSLTASTSSGHSSLDLDLQAAAFVSFVGFLGVLRNKASHGRLYRDCSAADLAFTAFLTLLAAYAAWAPGRLP